MSSKHANTIVSMSQKLLPACSWTAHVRLSKFPGQTDTRQTDTQKLTFGSPGTPIPNTHSKPGEANEVVPFFFLHKQGHGKVSHCALLKYNIIGYLLYRRVQDVLHQPNHYEKILFPTILKDAHLFCKETTIRNLNPKA